MREFSSVLLLLWIVCLQLGSCSYAEILWGQCYAFCLTRQSSRQKEENADSQLSLSERAISDCLKQRQCKWCLFACERPREDYDNQEDCFSDCKNSRGRHNEAALQACNESCKFISQSVQSKYGSCPSPLVMQGFNTACVVECSRDMECDGMKKCCDNGCGKICHKPLEFREFPSVPSKLSFKERNDGGMLVEWESHQRNATEPVIYVFRWWCSAYNVRYAVTSTASVKLKGYPSGVPPAAKCSFMVAAITVHGSEGFCPVQVFIKKFLSPSAPVNLETRSKLNNGKVDVTVRWQPPLYTDGLKVTRYLVFWSDNLPKASPNYMRLHMKKKAISADRTSYTIPNLEPSANYFVQVRAEVKWMEKTIRGKPASTYIETHSVPQPAGQDAGSIRSDGSLEVSSIYNVTVDEPVFANSQLQANVTWSVSLGASVDKYILYWAVDVCDKEASHRKTRERLKHEATVHKREFQLYKLQFGCVYELIIHTVTSGTMGKGIREYFRTLPCWETQSQGLDSICPPRVSPPAPPSDISVHYKSTRGCMCQAVIRWQRHSDKGHKVSQYSVLWGQSQPPPGGELTSAIVYYAEPYKIQVSGSENEACMTYLEGDKHYTAQIIAFVAKMKSRPAVLHFVTPASMPYCYGQGVITEGLESDFFGSVQKPTEEPPASTVEQYKNNTLAVTVNMILLVLSFVSSVMYQFD